MVKFGYVVIVVSLLATGCVAPGSATGHISIRGRVATDDGRPLAGRQVDLLLPAAYGLGGLDLVLNSPEDFGRADRTFSVTTDANGEFSYSLGAIIYHVTHWILPPLGYFPDRPPAPFFLARVPSFPGEYYAVQSSDGKFQIFNYDGAALSLAEAALSTLSAYSEPDESQRWPATVGVVELLFPNL